ncbi:hypothetical protein DL89DRAFT_84304 [Linderina pennispora]|uniref:Uncharacterized protein n=1 Tax=Linderina pennispora TaxID=61395 RepID=A0A1Y1WHF3_9FUNG|nr:uncharacterized protein DL89DRAFT_84304 [Linderina pennispora]ORX72892.1 hypothetical protein DL89DRAFT_84304 [Linderina pennispora]
MHYTRQKQPVYSMTIVRRIVNLVLSAIVLGASATQQGDAMTMLGGRYAKHLQFCVDSQYYFVLTNDRQLVFALA